MILHKGKTLRGVQKGMPFVSQAHKGRGGGGGGDHAKGKGGSLSVKDFIKGGEDIRGEKEILQRGNFLPAGTLPRGRTVRGGGWDKKKGKFHR